MSEQKNTTETVEISTDMETGRGAFLQSQDLFRDAKTLCIEHNGDIYNLRLTRNNKLILTK